MSLVFVYGTLKRGCQNHGRLAGQTFVDVARSESGYRLYDLGHYPGLVADATSPLGVIGEIWEVDEHAVADLDAFEGVNEGLYCRRPIRLLPPHADLQVDTYVYLPSVSGRRELDGEWLE